MVNLIWEDKKDNSSKLEDLKKFYLHFFSTFELYSYSSKNESKNAINSEVWKNKLFWGDNLEVLFFLLNHFEEKIDLIYIDPPFFSGSNYNIEIKEKGKTSKIVAYYDYWGKDLDSYLQMMYERIILFKKLLSQNGLLFIHLDWHANHYIRMILDEVFGENRFVNSIIWYYYNKYSAGKKNLPRAYDTILVYSKSNNYTFNQMRIPRKKPRKQLKREMVNGVLKNVKDENGHVIYRIVTDKKMDDVWRIPCLQPASKEWTGFPTQKHHKLLERIVKIGSNEGDLIADFFCGSGTSLVVAEKLNRRWIGCDISEYSIYLTRKRVSNYQKRQNNLKEKGYPFELLAHLNKEKKDLIETGFFNKNVNIKRI
ncbi:MAG: DNA methyltransferase [Candidatus Hermodarchaeota archaeon]